MKLTYEGVTRKIDSAGRIVLPKNLRNKYRLVEGSEVEYYTCNVDGNDYICVKAVPEKSNEEEA